MENTLLSRSKPLPEQIASHLKKMISNGEYPPGTLLPSENQLSIDLNTSRTSIRSAYDALEAQGIIMRRHGIGTYVVRLPSLANPYEQGRHLTDIIAAHGNRPGFQQLRADIIKADSRLASILRVKSGSEVLEVHKLFFADEIPIIYFVNHYPAWIFKSELTIEQAKKPGITEPPDKFLYKYCGIHLTRFNSIIHPEISSKVGLLDLFNFREDCTPILIVDDTGYDTEKNIVFHSVEYLTQGAAYFEVDRQISSLRNLD